jgi:hypothetical protein
MPPRWWCAAISREITVASSPAGEFSQVYLSGEGRTDLDFILLAAVVVVKARYAASCRSAAVVRSCARVNNGTDLGYRWLQAR